MKHDFTGNKPFASLAAMLEKKGVSLPVRASTHEPSKFQDSGSLPKTAKVMNAAEEQELFLQQMAAQEVVPLNLETGQAHAKVSKKTPISPVKCGGEHCAEPEMRMLRGLLEGGPGFVVSLTDEYVEGVGYGVHPRMAKKLHAGHFSIQAHLDLHGLRLEGAQKAFDAFLHRSLASGKRAVSVIHGRGLSSPNGPVLKTWVLKWLTKGPWRKWVIAFSSARACDGGAGATYILLRQRPATHRNKKGRKKWTI